MFLATPLAIFLGLAPLDGQDFFKFTVKIHLIFKLFIYFEDDLLLYIFK